MTKPVRLNGITWSHPRGYEPLVACAKIWKERTGVEIIWYKRSLQDFESFPVEELAQRFDLLVIDHPHVGEITAKKCLLPFDEQERAAEIQALRDGAVGLSFESYTWEGRHWALPIDAAAQVQAWRSDLTAAPARDWPTVMRLAEEGSVMCPLRPPHSLMAFFTIAANLGTPCASAGAPLIDREAGIAAYRLLQRLVHTMEPACFDMDPITVLDAMSSAKSRITCVPLIYGYVSYACEGFRHALISFCDIPSAGEDGPLGSALGGTGIAVSARGAYADACTDFAFWVASAEVQRGTYPANGGQPAHAAAWGDEFGQC